LSASASFVGTKNAYMLAQDSEGLSRGWQNRGTWTPDGPQTCILPPSGMIDWWPGDGNAKDIVGLNDGTPEGVTYTPGEVGAAFTFTYWNFVTFGSAGDFGTADFTVDFWVTTTTPTSNQIVLTKRQICDVGKFYDFVTLHDGSYIGPGGHMLIELMGGDRVNYDRIVTSRAITDGVAHLIALVRQGTTVFVYIDGALDSTGSTPNVVDVSNGAQLEAGESLCDWMGSDPITPFTGQIDEIELFNRALSASEILAIFSAGSAGKCKN
jgi:hypothetical protein